ncbi:MAG: 30S ribosomal protein S7 [Caldisericaceae bacterium]|nr:30S ribosomal protein S7 [Caldisericaceae bacterium]RLD19906.1 MAG: 30S ribosomal protein S7 [Caldisericota bacterium]
MPRRGVIKSKEILGDPVYNNVKLSRLINNVMLDGKKSLSQTIVYGAFDIIKEKMKKDPLEVFELALSNVRPLVEVKPRRVGGSTYQVPSEVEKGRGEKVSLKWIVRAARARTGKSMIEKLAQEIIDASNETGGAYKKKIDVHKMAEANRSYSHFRW